MSTVWVLGATGRVGSAVAALLAPHHTLVVTGRNEDRVAALLARLPGSGHTMVADSFDGVVQRIATMAHRPHAVVVNTVGPFVATAPTVIDSLPDGVHYVDMSNEYPAVQAVFDRDGVAHNRLASYVAAAGFGVLSTETALLTALAEHPEFGTPTSVRVDGVPSISSEAGIVGEALAGSIVSGFGKPGLEIRGGKEIRTSIGGAAEAFTTPDGDEVRTGSFPSGDLATAWRNSGAQNVVSASAFVPTGAAARGAVGAMQLITRIPGVVGFMTRQIAKRPTPKRPRPKEHSWARGRATWTSSDGSVTATAWFRAEDAMDFTVRAVVETARRLAAGHGRPGAWTAGALFGTDVAAAAGATLSREPLHR